MNTRISTTITKASLVSAMSSTFPHPGTHLTEQVLTFVHSSKPRQKIDALKQEKFSRAHVPALPVVP